MRILFTNNAFAHRGGSEMAVLDLAKRLKRKGHLPVAYSQELGEVANELVHSGIPVISDLDALQEQPDVIHGHHHLETMAACLHFSGVPAIYVCNGWLPWHELPPTFPTIMTYVGVGDVTRERIVTSVRLDGRPAIVVPTFFDEDLFQPKHEISASARRALIYSNTLTGKDKLVKDIAAACAKRHISLDTYGLASGKTTARPDALLLTYDVVFAVGRSAVEAMACGCAVVVCDKSGIAGMAQPGDFTGEGRNKLKLNERSLEQISSSTIGEQLDLYDASRIALVRDEIRAQRSLGSAVARFEEIYADAIARFPESGAREPARLLDDASRYIRSLAAILKHMRSPAPEA